MYKIKKFTLIEVIAVIAILGILCAIVIPNISNKKEVAMVTQVKSNISSIQTAMDMYAYENGGRYASVVQPTIEEPQMVAFDMLYPKYLKSLPKNILGEYYWVDFMGKVWSSTVDAPKDIFSSESYVEWNSDKNVNSYNVYRILKIKNLGLINNTKLTLKQTIVNHSDLDRFIAKTDEDLLISSIDKFGLETAPVGMGYKGIPEDWFTPIISKEGTFEFTMSSEELMYWDGFYVNEKKPEGTEIIYNFSVLDFNNNQTTFTEDFYSLEPSKSITIKITMIGHNGKLPSLLDFRLYYHYSYEDKLIKKPIRDIEDNKVKDIVQLLPNESIDSIVFPNNITQKPVIEYSPDGIVYSPVDSIKDIPKDGGYVSIVSDKGAGISGSSKPPIVKVTSDNVKIQDIDTPYVSKDDSVIIPSKPNDPAVTEKGWDTVQEIVFVASAADGQMAHWISADIEDKQPENTRILYRYSTGNGFGWTNYVEDFSKLSDSKMLKIYCVLQVKNEYISKVENPEVVSIKINSSKGLINLDTVKPTGSIKLIKDNNKNREVISTASNIKWEYEAFDPQGKKITEIIWGGDKRDRYETPGTYIVTLKLKNELNYWSDEIKITFDVKEEIPTAIIGPIDRNYYSSRFPVNLNFSNSYDSDGDKIVKSEWGGDYKENGIYSPGTYTVKMRVQDEEGYWSEWSSKTFEVIDSIFYGIDFKALDNDDITYVSTTDRQMVSWEGDLENRVVTIIFSGGGHSSTSGVKLSVLDSNENPLEFEDADNNNVYTSVFKNSLTTVNIVIPKNAKYLSFSQNNSSSGIAIYTIKDYPDKVLPNSVTNIKSTSTNSSITLNWTNPIDEDFSKVAIYRNGLFVGYSSTGTFVDTPLYSDTEYEYQIQNIDTTGNRGNKVVYITKTTKPDVVWHGSSPVLFDDNDSTYLSTKERQIVSWDGDLESRIVTIVFSGGGSSSTSGAVFQVLDSNNNPLEFEDADNNKIYTSIFRKSIITINIVIPKNAKYLSFSQNNSSSGIAIYTIKDYPDKILPNPVTNVTSTSSKSSITLNWTNPSDEDFNKVVIYRDGVFVGYSSTGTFVDTPLYSDMEYTYQIHSIDTTGNRGNSVEYGSKTTKPDIVWRGYSPALFDNDDNTFSSTNTTQYITWGGDLEGKKVKIKFSGGGTYASSGAIFQIVDKDDVPLEFIDTDNNTILTKVFIKGTKTSNIIIPENASKIKFYLQNSSTMNVYTVQEIQ